MKKLLVIVIVASLQLFAFDLSSAASMFGATQSQEKSEVKTTSNPLISLLTSSLGVSDTQAIGGTTAILSKAASNMTGSDVSALTSAVPALSTFMGKDSAVGSLLGASSLGSQFSALGMDSSMVAQFIPVILQFINSEAGSGLMQSVQSALK